ncbi:MAG: LacI family DNA-binding transcriptional regulator [Lachnospiraceae bacterium]|nr:LacI family DNA-binding transcriptional regulator [Lachnospiraceae bacterium]
MNQIKKICVIMADITEDYRDEFIVGIEKQANKLGYHTFVFSMPLLDEIHTKKEEEIYGLIDFEQYDGVVFFRVPSLH